MSSLGDYRDVKHRTIFHDLLESKTLPLEDKTVGRLWQEAQLLLSAGTVTTATAISSALVYLLLDPNRMQILLEELENAMPDILKPKRQTELEQLPYLVRIPAQTASLWYRIVHNSFIGLTVPRTQSFKRHFESHPEYPTV
jgi:hypothetical protein